MQNNKYFSWFELNSIKIIFIHNSYQITLINLTENNEFHNTTTHVPQKQIITKSVTILFRCPTPITFFPLAFLFDVNLNIKNFHNAVCTRQQIACFILC